MNGEWNKNNNLENFFGERKKRKPVYAKKETARGVKFFQMFDYGRS